MISIVAADDHPIVREGLQAILTSNPAFCVLGTAATGEEAVEAVQTLRPDVLLLDLEMPGMGGLAAIKEILGVVNEQRIIVLTTFASELDIVSALKAGAIGYLLKDTPPQDLFSAIRSAVAGERALGPDVTERLVQRVVGSGEESLTERELEVLELVAAGLGNEEIASTLFLSKATVKTHLVHLYRKLGVSTRTAAVRQGLENGAIRRR